MAEQCVCDVMLGGTVAELLVHRGKDSRGNAETPCCRRMLGYHLSSLVDCADMAHDNIFSLIDEHRLLKLVVDEPTRLSQALRVAHRDVRTISVVQRACGRAREWDIIKMLAQDAKAAEVIDTEPRNDLAWLMVQIEKMYKAIWNTKVCFRADLTDYL